MTPTAEMGSRADERPLPAVTARDSSAPSDEPALGLVAEWRSVPLNETADTVACGNELAASRPGRAHRNGKRAPTPQPPDDGTPADTTLSPQLDHPCPHCGSRMVIIEMFGEGATPRHRPSLPAAQIPINTP